MEKKCSVLPAGGARHLVHTADGGFAEAMPEVDCDTFEECIAQARGFLKNKRPDFALPFIHRAMQLDTVRPETFNLLGVAEELRDNVENARKLYRVALTLDPAYKPADNNIKRVCAWRYTAEGMSLGDEQERFILRI